MFKPKHCPICEEKEKRIADLLSQVEMLRLLIIPPKSASHSILSIEADQVLSGSDEPIQITDQQAELDREAAALLSGSYDLSQVETY